MVGYCRSLCPPVLYLLLMTTVVVVAVGAVVCMCVSVSVVAVSLSVAATSPTPITAVLIHPVCCCAHIMLCCHSLLRLLLTLPFPTL